MKSKSIKNALVIAALLFLVSSPLWINYLFQHVTAENVTVTIKDKERVTDGDKSKYLVFTDSETFENIDAMMSGKFSSSDLYGKLEIGKTYTIRVYGYRIPFFSVYRNIVSIQ